MKKRGPYKIIKSRIIYKNPWIKVREDSVIKPNGEKGIFGIIDYQPGTSIVALNKNEEVYLVKSFDYAVGEYCIQLPSGGINKNEKPLDAAKRELLEETGIVAKQWIELGFVHPLTVVLNSPAYLFLALDLKQKAQPEKNAQVLQVSLTKACHMVLNGKINPAQNGIAILRACHYLKK